MSFTVVARGKPKPFLAAWPTVAQTVRPLKAKQPTSRAPVGEQAQVKSSSERNDHRADAADNWTLDADVFECCCALCSSQDAGPAMEGKSVAQADGAQRFAEATATAGART